MNLWEYFTDPVLRAPMIGSIMMCVASSLVGVLVFIRKRSLLGEALSHATFPGVVLSVIVMAAFFPFSEKIMAIGVLVGAFCSSLLGLFCIDYLERKMKVKDDAALCFILSSFFGVGVLIASHVQLTHAVWYQQIQIFLFGQAATMTDLHVWIYIVLAALTALCITIFYQFIRIMNFDRVFANTLQMPAKRIERVLFFLLTLAIVIGIRSVGVVLMSAMLISPAVSARQFTHRLSSLFLVAALFGMLAAFFGNYFSLEIPRWLQGESEFPTFSLPTGPMIVVSGAILCLLSLTFSPYNGLLSRLLRAIKFRHQCLRENILKLFWKKGDKAVLSHGEIVSAHDLSDFTLACILYQMKKKEWIEEKGIQLYALTPLGEKRAAHIVRLHRLWEAYLVYLGQRKDKVHMSAEEMEHILTPEMEKELALVLGNPKSDPHKQPIPP